MFESDDLFETQPELMVESHRLLYALDLHRTSTWCVWHSSGPTFMVCKPPRLCLPLAHTGMGMLHYNLLFWIGPAGAKTGLHSDIDARNLLFQLHGKKVFGMFPPDQVGAAHTRVSTAASTASRACQPSRLPRPHHHHRTSTCTLATSTTLGHTLGVLTRLLQTMSSSPSLPKPRRSRWTWRLETSSLCPHAGSTMCAQ